MVTNLFPNPDMVATSGEVVVWENLHPGSSPSTHPQVWSYASDAQVSQVADGVEASFSEDGFPTSIFYTPTGSRIPVDGGDIISWRIGVRNSGPHEMHFYIGIYPDSGGSLITSGEVRLSPGEAYEWVEEGLEVPAGAGTVRFSVTRTVTYDEVLAGSRLTLLDGVVLSKTPRALLPFSGYRSPDPDLTPTWVGAEGASASRLVGRAVAGLATRSGECVAVQSSQWSKSGGVSARLINTGGYLDTGRSWVRVDIGTARAAVVWYRQEGPVTAAEDTGTIYRYNPRTNSNRAPNSAGEVLLRAYWDDDYSSDQVRVEGAAGFGESVWFDLFTITDTAGYDGPPFSGATPNEDVEDGVGWVYEWSGTPNRSTSTRVWGQIRDIYVRVLDEFDAPAVGITVEGLSSVESSRVAIYRQTPGKERTLVQGLGNVDVDGAGYWVDYLPPLGVPVTYVVEVLEGDPLEENSATITIPSSTAWLQDALNPLLAVEVACRPGNRDTLFFTAEAFTAFERPTNSDLVQIMGGRTPVGMTSRRQTPAAIPFNMVTTAAEASSLLREVLIEGTHLVLRVPPEISMLDPVTYLSDVQVSEEPGRQSFLGGHVIRWNMTGSQTRGPRIMAWTALWTYDDVAELYAGYSYTDLTDGRRYVDWQARPDEAQLAGFSTTSGGSNA